MDKPADKAKKQMQSMGLSAPYMGSKETRTEEEVVQDRKTLAENVPILGEAMLAKEIADDVKDENYLSAGLNTLALGVGAIPVAGDIINKPIRAAARAMRKDVKVKPTSVAGPYYDAPTYGDYHSRAAQVDQEKGLKKLKELKGKNADFNLIQETVSESRIGNTRGQTAQADKVSFDPAELKNVKGLMGEELYRSGNYTPPGRGSKLKLLKKNIKEKGYKPVPITIVVREDGAPFIAEGNHRLAEALESGRSKIDANIQYLRNAEKVDGPLSPKRLNDPKTDIDLLVRTTNETKKPTKKLNKVTTKSTRKGYNPEDPASRVFHLTKTDFDAADVVGKGTNDIGFHVGTAAQANARGSTGVKYDKELAEKMVEKERVLPMVLKQTLKPARIIDVGSFKEPKNWISNLSVAKKDKQLINFLLGDSADADLLAKAPRVTVGGDTYFMLPDVMRSGVDENLWKDIILEAHRARRLGLDTINKQSDRVEWFNTLKQTANKNGYDSFVYKNEYEGAKELGKSASKGDSYMLLEPDQAKGLFGGMTEGNPAYMKNKGGLMLQSGGAVPMNNMSKQMELFEPVTRGFDEGGLMDEGGTVDPVSGNDVPPGSNQEEVRDDIPAQLSEGEFVFPADVVRFIGLEKLMMIRQRAKAGLQRMEDMGQMGNSEEAVMPDDLPFSIDDLDMEDDGLEMAQGGVVQAANGTFVQPTPTTPNAGVFYNPAAQPTTGVAAAPMQAASASAAPSVGQAATPVQAGSGKPTMFTNYQLPQAPVPVMTAPDQLPKFLGEAVPGVGGVDYTEETYVNEAGQTIKFRRYNDGSLKDSSGNEAVIPEGYKIKSEAEETVTTAPTTVETATVQDNGRDDNFEEDQAKMELDQSRVDAAKAMGYTNFAGIGQGILSTLGLTTLPEGTVTGIGFVSDGKGSIFDPLTGRPIAAGIKDALKNSWNEISSTLKGEDRLTRDLIAKGKEQETKFGRDFYKAAGVAKVDRIFAGIKDDIKDGKYGDVDFDDFSENYIDEVQKSIRAEAEKGNYITEDGRIANPFEASGGRNRGDGRFDDEPPASAPSGPPSSAADYGALSPEDLGSMVSQGQDDNQGGSEPGAADGGRDESSTSDAGGAAGFSGDYGGGFDFNKGGLAKQMKRSGLASKK